MMSLFTAACLLSAAAPVYAQEGIEISFTLEQKDSQPADPTVGDVLQLVLEIHHPAGSQAVIPTLPAQWGSFEVRTQLSVQTETLQNGTQVTRQMISAALFAPGEHTTPAFAVSIQGQDGQVTEVPVPPLTVQVRSVLQEGDTQLRDIKPQARLNVPFPWLWLLGALLAGLLAFSVWRLIAARKHTPSPTVSSVPDPRPPHQAALEELARIAALKLPEIGDFKTHYTLLTDCLRRYLEQQFGLRALDRTTRELRITLIHTHFPPEAAQGIMALFEQADLAKFARFKPAMSGAYQDLQKASDLVRQTTPAPEPPAAPVEGHP